jgi:hypothetical protein
MNATTIKAVIQSDGELHLSELPFVKGDRVEAVISVLNTPADMIIEEKKRDEAKRQFLEIAKASTFRSTGPYPTRDELHERH